MEITNIDVYLDGGTIEIATSDVIYCIDSRITTKTKGSIFFGYPKEDNSNIIQNQDKIKMEITNALEKYIELDSENFNLKQKVYELLNIN